VDLLKTGSAYYAPSASQLELVRAIVGDQHRLLPATAHLSGQYGLKDLYLGVPIVLGRKGVERVVEVDLTPAERSAFDQSAAAVGEDLDLLAKLPE
jgi:malate dehydrogenase